MPISEFVLRAALPVSAAVVLGTAVAGWGGAGQAPIVASVAGAVAGGVLGNIADRWLGSGGQYASDAFGRLRRDGSLPPNHDLARAIRRSQLRAIILIADVIVAREIAAGDDGDRSSWLRRVKLERFARDVRKWSRKAMRMTKRGQEFAVTTAVQILSDHIELLCDEAGVVQAPPWQEAASAALAELDAAGIVWRPAEFDRAVLDGAREFAWSTATHALLWEEIKKEAAVYRVLSLRMLHRIDRSPRQATWQP